MTPVLQELITGWQLDPKVNTGAQIAVLLESLQADGLLRASTNAVLLGEQYHLGGAGDTRRMAEALGITAADRVLDLACYVGGPARQLARDYACQVVGVDISGDCVAIAEKLTQLCGMAGDMLLPNMRFICCSADAVPLPDESFTIAWSQGSFPSDLSWLPEMRRLLRIGGRLAFTSSIRRKSVDGSSNPLPAPGPAWEAPASLEEIVARVADFGFHVISAEDISEMDLECGWYPAKEKLEVSETHYRELMGEDWVRQAYAELDIEIESWRSGREGEGRIIAVKE